MHPLVLRHAGRNGVEEVVLVPDIRNAATLLFHDAELAHNPHLETGLLAELADGGFCDRLARFDTSPGTTASKPGSSSRSKTSSSSAHVSGCPRVT